MMNTIEYIKERNRMCKSYDEGCKGCPALDDLSCAVGNESTMDVAEQIAIVERWAKEHSIKTLQDVFLEQYPEAQLDKHGVIQICPAYISDSYRDNNGNCIDTEQMCVYCRRKFWLQEAKGE